MAAKFNKDTILKHRFWIIISVALVLSLFGIFYLGVIVSADTTKLVALHTNAFKYNPKANQKVVEESAKHAEKAKNSEAGIWKKAYEMQEKLFLFAPNVESEFDLYYGKFTSEVKIDKAPADAKEWPANEAEDVKLGILTRVEPEWFEIKDKDNKAIKFHKTDSINGNITAAGEDKKLNFPELRKYIGSLATVKYQVGKYFMEPLTRAEQLAFKESYKKQVLKILKSVDPYNEKGEGVVQLKDWVYRDDLPEEEFVVGGAGGGGGGGGPMPIAGGARPGGAAGGIGGGKMPFIRYVAKPWGGDGFKSFSEEAWIAQENLWIQEEIYRIIREANDSISVFKLQSKTVDKRGVPVVYTNSFLEAELTLDAKNNLTFKVKNRLPRNQKLDLLFRVKTNKGLQSELIKVSGPSLKPAGTQGDSFVKEEPEAGDSPRTGIYSVEQVLNWETAAVKRIDYISIGSADTSEISHSHRTYDKLKPYLEEKVVEAPKDADPMKPGAPGPGMGLGNPQQAGGNKTMLDHDLWTHRYSELTEQSRRIPVAIVMIVDQGHVDRILNAFNNSKLRFLQSQVLLNYYNGSMQPPIFQDTKEGGGGIAGEFGGPGFNPMPGIAGGGRGSREGPGPMPGVAGGMGNPGAVGSGTPEMETNMELVIYGVMTIYQRYPPRSAPKAAAQ